MQSETTGSNPSEWQGGESPLTENGDEAKKLEKRDQQLLAEVIEYAKGAQLAISEAVNPYAFGNKHKTEGWTRLNRLVTRQASETGNDKIKEAESAHNLIDREMAKRILDALRACPKTRRVHLATEAIPKALREAKWTHDDCFAALGFALIQLIEEEENGED